jgi:endonuclease-3
LTVPRSEHAALIVDRLAAEYPDADCELDFRSPWELLVATVLSAQCTDVRVNRVTPELFRKWPNPADLAAAGQGEVEEVIRSTGMFRTKSKALRATAQIVEHTYGGEVPAEIDALIALPGVGRKTAKVVLGEGFGIAAGVIVDTHVRRLARRLGLTIHDDAERVASELEEIIPRSAWIEFSTRMIYHGRRVCSARNPRCEGCVFEDLCPRVGVPD